MANIKESAIEQHLVDAVEQRGGVCFKVVSPGKRGFFDRIVVVDGQVVFVETKKPRGGRVSPQQKLMHQRFREAGARVEIARTIAAVDALVDSLSRLSE